MDHSDSIEHSNSINEGYDELQFRLDNTIKKNLASDGNLQNDFY